jgi:diacylglycerol kinase (ATP)
LTARRALMVVNANARNGGEALALVPRFEAEGIQVRVERPERGADVSRLIQLHSTELDLVIVCGGDGTMNSAADGILRTGLPLGIMPLGTANDLARTLGIPDTADAAAGVILAGRTRAVDLGTVNEIPFFNVASLGLSVGVTRRLQGIMKRRLGVLAYPVAAAVTVVKSGRFRASLRADGEEVPVATLQIAVGNGRYYGGGTVVEQTAEIDDGLLDVYSLEPRARWRLLFMARAFRAGEHRKLREVRNLRCRTLTITTRRAREVSADGEIVTRTPANFGVLPQAVRVFVP